MNEYEIIQHRQMEGISLFFNTVDYRTPHVHMEWELIWVLDQPLAVICGQKHFTVQPGQMVLFSPREPHEFHRVRESCTFLCLQISPIAIPEVDRLRVDGLFLENYLSAEEYLWIQSVLTETAEAYFLRNDRYELLCMGNCNLIMHKLLTKLPCRILSAEENASIDRRNARLQRFFQFVDDNYMNKITLADFAQAEGCSVTYISHFIKDTMNMTFREYVNSVRFHSACKLIAGGNRKMLDVCIESGFSDYRYFVSMFRKQFGVTPEQYSRQIAREKPELARLQHSLHSVERFYNCQESMDLLTYFTKN